MIYHIYKHSALQLDKFSVILYRKTHSIHGTSISERIFSWMWVGEGSVCVRWALNRAIGEIVRRMKEREREGECVTVRKRFLLGQKTLVFNIRSLRIIRLCVLRLKCCVFFIRGELH